MIIKLTELNPDWYDDEKMTEKLICVNKYQIQLFKPYSFKHQSGKVTECTELNFERNVILVKESYEEIIALMNMNPSSC